ncbi:MAG TPA: HDIG domain-containing protein [Dehalococcoidia bacterium]|nr:HDIG domain-containing protein [Dehalococcoidia bacterium]
MPTRDDAWQLLCEYTKGENLRKHGLAVEAVMRAYAREYDPEREETWAIVGLLHDFDYEMHPNADEHPMKGSPILRERGYPEEVVYAIQCHADYLGLDRKTKMDQAIFAVDELTGMITATALVKPNKSLDEVDARSVRKKMKDKAFAKSIIREDIVNGAAGMGVDLDEHITFTIEAMKPIAPELGLAGS